MNLNINKYPKENPNDAIVVLGTGICDGWAAKELIEKVFNNFQMARDYTLLPEIMIPSWS
jgi:hypothetical protein